MVVPFVLLLDLIELLSSDGTRQRATCTRTAADNSSVAGARLACSQDCPNRPDQQPNPEQASLQLAQTPPDRCQVNYVLCFSGGSYTAEGFFAIAGILLVQYCSCGDSITSLLLASQPLSKKRQF